MSGVYRVEIVHKPGDTFGEWEATAYRISDGAFLGLATADDPDAALVKVRDAIGKKITAQEPRTVELDDELRIVSQSVGV